MVAAVSAAKAGPHFQARIPDTKLTSRTVGTTLKTMLERMKLMPARKKVNSGAGRGHKL